MASAGAPATEAELLQRLPPSNSPGVFPRDVLPPTERVLFETRPSFFGLYWGRTIWFGFWALLCAWGFYASPGNDEGFVLILLLFGLPFYLSIPFWYKTAYALTDHRVLKVSGLTGSDFQEATFAQIQNLATEPGISGGLRFDATPAMGAAYSLLGTAPKPRHIKWEALRDAARVYEFVQEAFAFGLRQEASQQALATAWKDLGGGAPTVRCAYCGSLVEVRSLNPADMRCTSCRAPIQPV